MNTTTAEALELQAPAAFPGEGAHDGYFVSGTNHPGEIRGLMLSGNHVGVCVSELKTGALDELLSYAGGPTKVFVDSGAFAEVGFGPAGIFTKKEITGAEWLKRLAVYVEVAKAFRAKAYLVAPDKIADQQETLARLARYETPVARAACYGANVIVPVQKGALSMAAFWIQAKALVVAPEEQIIAGIPSKKDATSIEELVAFVQAARPARIHLLGLGVRSPRYAATVAAIEAIDPTIAITCDSVRITAMVGRKGRKNPRVLTAAQDTVRAEGISDVFDVKCAALWRVMMAEHDAAVVAARAAGWRDDQIEEA